MDLTILVIDDHPPIVEGYKNILTDNDLGYTINLISANDCETAYNIITNSENKTVIHLVLLDVLLPPYLEKMIHSGEDLVPIIRKNLPNTKIAILTSLSDYVVLSRILNYCNPEGLLLKNDLNSKDFLSAFSAIISGENHYSKSVLKHKLYSASSTKKLDNYNRQIIILLSQGYKTKSIQEQLHLSKSAVDKRKVAIKEFFDIEKGNDEDILREARKRNLI